MLLFVLGFYSCNNPEIQVNKPNFIFLLVDDLGWTDLGCYGSKFYETPNIDKLASDGMIWKIVPNITSSVLLA